MLSACAEMTPPKTAEMAELAFESKLMMFEPGEFQFQLGIANLSGRDQPMVEDVNINAVVTNEEGAIRNRFIIVDLPAIPAGEAKFPLTYEATYDPGQYVMSITGESIPSHSFSFEIREENGILKLVANPEYIDPHTNYIITDPDL